MSFCWLFNTIYIFSSKHTDASLEHSGSNSWSYAAKFGQWNRCMSWSPRLRKSPVHTHTLIYSYTQILIYSNTYIYIHICRKDEVDRIRALHNISILMMFFLNLPYPLQDGSPFRKLRLLSGSPWRRWVASTCSMADPNHGGRESTRESMGIYTYYYVYHILHVHMLHIYIYIHIYLVLHIYMYYIYIINNYISYYNVS